jgi:hypothetical protein
MNEQQINAIEARAKGPPEVWDVRHTHAVAGYEIIELIREIRRLRRVIGAIKTAEMVLRHHDLWDSDVI